MKRISILMMMAVCSIWAWAYNVSGVIVDEEREPMVRATVRVLNQTDSTATRGAIADDDGRFSITDVKRGNYILEATYVGYDRFTRQISVDRNMRVDTIVMHEDAITLKGTTVVGVKTPVKVMEDTIEFNADSYKVQPNAVVEDLLKRLPGVEVDSDGKITSNGKEVTKILVDGKEFFSDDPKVASKNLPVNMIDKLQVVDRKSDLARMTGVDDGEDETVINLTVKKGMKNGWFGTIEGGYGTDDRYKGQFNVNRFWNENQITFIGGLNNVNDLQYTDGNSGRFRRFGGGSGITKSEAFGVNFNVGNGEIFRVGGDVMYTHMDRDSRTKQERQYLFADSTSYLSSNKVARDKSHNIRADFRIKWEPDSFNTLEFMPNMSLNYNDATSAETSLTRSGLGQDVTRSQNTSASTGHSQEFGARLIYNHNFERHRGRSFSVMAFFRSSNVRENTNTMSLNRFFMLNDSIFAYNQDEDDHTWNNNVTTRVTWTEPLGDASKGHFLTFAYRFQYRWNNADKIISDYAPFYTGIELNPVLFNEIAERNDSLCNEFRNDYMNQDFRLGYKYISKAHTIDVGFSVVPQMSKSVNLTNEAKSIPARHVVNFAPYLRYRLKLGKQTSMNFDYMGRSSQPSMTQLQPVADYSDPLNIKIGNPSLDPSFNHNIRLRFQDFNMEQQRSVMVMAFGNVEQNSIISRTTFNRETGGRTTTYENVNGVWSAHAMTMFSMPLRNKSFSINNHLMTSYSNNIGYNNGLRNRSGQLFIREQFGFAYRPDNLELELRPYYSLQKTYNTLKTVSANTVHGYGGSFNATYYAPFGLVLASDLNYSATEGYAHGYDKQQWLWNASISYQFLKDRAATVTLTGYDLLQQRSNIWRNVTANYIDDTEYNSLTRYFMLTFSYKFNTFGSGNQPTDRNADPYRQQGPPPGMSRRQPIR